MNKNLSAKIFDTPAELMRGLLELERDDSTISVSMSPMTAWFIVGQMQLVCKELDVPDELRKATQSATLPFIQALRLIHPEMADYLEERWKSDPDVVTKAE